LTAKKLQPEKELYNWKYKVTSTGVVQIIRVVYNLSSRVVLEYLRQP